MGLIKASPACRAAPCPCPWRRWWHSPFLAGGDHLGPERCAQCGPASVGFPVGGSRARGRWSGRLISSEGVALFPLQRRKCSPEGTCSQSDLLSVAGPGVEPGSAGCHLCGLPTSRLVFLALGSDTAIFLHAMEMVTWPRCAVRYLFVSRPLLLL